MVVVFDTRAVRRVAEAEAQHRDESRERLGLQRRRLFVRRGASWPTRRCVDDLRGCGSGQESPWARRGQRHLGRPGTRQGPDLRRRNDARIPASRPFHSPQQLRRSALFQQPKRFVGQPHAAYVQARRSPRGFSSTCRGRAAAGSDGRRGHRGATTRRPEQERPRCGSRECAKDARSARRERSAAHGRVSGLGPRGRAPGRGELHRHGRDGLFPDAFLRDAHGRAIGRGAAPYDRRLQQGIARRCDERIDSAGVRMRPHPRHQLHAGGRAFGVHVRPRARTSLHRGDVDPKGWSLPGVPFRSARGRRPVRQHHVVERRQGGRALPQARRHQGRPTMPASSTTRWSSWARACTAAIIWAISCRSR